MLQLNSEITYMTMFIRAICLRMVNRKISALQFNFSVTVGPRYTEVPRDWG